MKIICTSCDKKVEKAELTGKRMIRNKLIDYYLCKFCVNRMPPAYFHTTKKVNERQTFWESLEKKMVEGVA